MLYLLLLILPLNILTGTYFFYILSASKCFNYILTVCHLQYCPPKLKSLVCFVFSQDKALRALGATGASAIVKANVLPGPWGPSLLCSDSEDENLPFGGEGPTLGFLGPYGAMFPNGRPKLCCEMEG